LKIDSRLTAWTVDTHCDKWNGYMDEISWADMGFLSSLVK